MKNKIKLFVFLLLLPVMISAQKDTVRYSLSLSGLSSTGVYAPFWLQSLNYGKVFNSPNTSYASAAIFKDYGDRRRLFDYAFKADFLVRSDLEINGIYTPIKNEFYFHELYAKARFMGMNLVVGSIEEIIGNQDSTLSTGGFIFSKNARPIPKITLGLTNFTAIPGSGNLVFIKGAISHGWFLDNIKTQNILLHHKYLYLRIIGSESPFWIEGGVDHFAHWGGTGAENINFGNFLRIFFGKQGGIDAHSADQINALGNHLISQSVKAGANFGDYKISAYWQNLSEDGPLKFFWGAMNREDGLLGISIKNKGFSIVNGFLYEYLNTTDQSGPYHDKDGMIYGGADSYFGSGPHVQGWSNYGRTIGTPFITSRIYNVDGPEGWKLNNMVKVHHLGIEGVIASLDYKILASYNMNYGHNRWNPYKTMRPNTSLMLELNKKFGKKQTFETKLSLGADVGEMYGNNMGAMFTIKKTGDLFRLKSPRILGNPTGL